VTHPNQQQFEAWNGSESVHYVDHADRYDRQLQPVTEAILGWARLGGGEAVLDIGCGCGLTSLLAGAGARSVLGVDISQPLIRVATERARASAAANVEFVAADAQTYEFEEGAFDVVISQFGLMFFDDPVGAFSNIRRSMAVDGRIVFSTWKALDANEWLGPVVRAVSEHAEVPDLGGLANGGGMFALKDEAETADLLDAAGFTEVSVEPIAPTFLLGGGGSLDECADFLFGMGIVRGLLGRLDAEQRESAVGAIRADLEAGYDSGTGIRLQGGVWLVTART
jgi:SAM-dependent methyltransferase